VKRGAKFTREIPLTRGYVALVDATDYARLSRYRWFANVQPGGRVYAVRGKKAGGKSTTIYLHREVLGLPPGRVPYADHINRDTLNNQRSNLRVADPGQNAANTTNGAASGTSRFRGVSRAARANNTNKWLVQIAVRGVRRRVGYFWTEETAAAAYDAALVEAYGEYALTNVKLGLLAPSATAHEAYEPPLRACRQCGDLFTTTNPLRRYCSDRCRHQARYRRGVAA
jgi:hypothetical protein